MIDHDDGVQTRRRPGPPSDAIMNMADALVARLNAGEPAAAQTQDDDAPMAYEPAVPSTLGRFEVDGQLGAGAMGVVYAARDPLLKRTVAIKVLAPQRTSTIALARAYREAQAMAQISHPNVVQLYGIGEHDGGLYLAMEMIDGETLASWQTVRRPAHEVLSAYRQAGQGLAKLHEHGLVHRDFKPANAMVGRDGRVRVLDLGLVRELQRGSASEEGEQRMGRSLSSGSETHSDAILGTPAYMAPEQFLGDEVTAAADQFSFCVALYEALYGHRPFAARTMVQLVEAIADQRIEPPPAGRKVPRGVLSVLRRGLARDPSRRHPSMSALLDALQRAGGRGRGLFAGVGVLAVAGIGLATLLGSAGPAAPEQNAENPAAVGIDEDEAAAISAEIERAETLRLEGDYDEALALITDAVSRAQRLGANKLLYEAYTERGGLWARRRELDAAASDFAAAYELALVARDDVGVAQVALSSVWVAQNAGDLDAAEHWLEVARTAVTASGSDSTERARLLMRTGEVEWARGNTQEAHVALTAAAQAWHAQDDAREEATTLNVLNGVQMDMGDLDGALKSTQRCIDLLRGAFGDEEPQLGTAYQNLGNVWQRKGDTDKALAAFTEAVRRSRATHGPEHIATAFATFSRGTAELDAGMLDEARASMEWVQAHLPPEHFVVAAADASLGAIAFERGDHPEALSHNLKALVAMEARFGSEHPDVGEVRVALSRAKLATGDAPGALKEAQRSRAVLERHFGPEHDIVGKALEAEAQALTALGRVDEAMPLFQRAVAIVEAVQGADSDAAARLRERIKKSNASAGDNGKRL